MSGALEVLVWVSLGITALIVGGRCVLYFSARAALRSEFRDPNCEITRIESFDGFLDLGSIRRAITSTGYYVHVQSKNEAAKVFCLVRYVPIVGFAWAVERWTDGEVSPEE
jgi:hypothetical protein